MEEYAYDIWLTQLPGMSPRKIERILLSCGSAKECFNMKEKELERIYGITEKDMESILSGKKNAEPERLPEKLRESGISVVKKGEKGYPKSLLQISDPPYLLFFRGKLPDPSKVSVAIVGARQCSEYGKAMARTAARALAEAGVTVVSGMAAGIDAISHLGALDADGETIAVLGNGPDICYPKSSRNLYERLIASGGILSEYAPGVGPEAWHFPMRNRIISGLCDALIVVEARSRSGSLITADYALEQGKDIYAFPGRITDGLSGGTNRLIRQGAYPVVSVEELLRDLRIGSEKIAEKTDAQKITLAKDEMVVYSCLDFVPKNLEQLMEETQMPLPALSETIFELRKKGFCEETFQNHYRRGY